MHVRGLPALHHRFAHDLQVSVGLIVSGVSIMPGGLAVLSLRENGLSSGGHFCFGVVVVWFWCGRFGRLCLRTEEGEKAGGGGLYRSQKC